MGYTNLVRFLVENGAIVMSTDKNQFTPLHFGKKY